MRDVTKSNIVREAEAAQGLIMELQSDDSELNHDMIEGETSFFEAVEMALDEIRDCAIISEGIKAKVAELGKRKSRVDLRADRLRGLIEQAFAIAEINSHTFPCETVTVKKKTPTLIISDESKIPSKYWEPQPPKLNKKDLFADVKAGPVEGVEKSNGGTSLQIRKS